MAISKNFNLEFLKHNPEKIQQLLDEAYLKLGDTSELILENPLKNKTKFDIENPHLHLLSLMRNPDYFGITCKWLFNVDLLPFQCAILKELWIRKFPMLVGSRGMGKTWLLSLYCILKALFDQGSKGVIVGAAFRQSKILFEYMETFWRNSPILKHIVGTGPGRGPKRDIDRCTFYIGQSVIHSIPVGDGSKIRGLRSTYTIAEEFASINEEIFETVIGGFGAVNLNPVELVKRRAQINLLKDLGIWNDTMEENYKENSYTGNQTIISGTAYYSFNHFAKYHKKWHDIIEHGNNKEKMLEVFGGEIPRTFNPANFSIIRVPFSKLPEGLMDEETVARAKATIHSSIYQMEYETIFCTDSDGFFKRSLIESCICTNLEHSAFSFSAVTRGNPNGTYVFGVDPASERDNFSIVVVEKHKDHSRIVFCWTITKKQHKARVKHGVTDEHNFYSYCARKIRDLMKVFPTEHIAIDSQGGGVAIMEALQDPNALKENDQRIFPYTKRKNDEFWWEKEDKPTDGEQGQHILHVVEFSKSDWVSEANHGLRKDFEDKKLLFPHFDPYVISESIEYDAKKFGDISDDMYSLYDTLEDCVTQIEELKDELTIIQYTQTPSGKDKWDTPETVEGTGKKGRLKKDRYSALLMANMISRTLLKEIPKEKYDGVGGFVGKNFDGINTSGPLYIGNTKYTSRLTGIGIGVVRN